VIFPLEKIGSRPNTYCQVTKCPTLQISLLRLQLALLSTAVRHGIRGMHEGANLPTAIRYRRRSCWHWCMSLSIPLLQADHLMLDNIFDPFVRGESSITYSPTVDVTQNSTDVRMDHAVVYDKLLKSVIHAGLQSSLQVYGMCSAS